MTHEVRSVLFAASLITAATTGCVTAANDGADGTTLGESAQAIEEQLLTLEDGGGGGGGSYPDPIVVSDGTSGMYLSVGYLTGGYIYRGTFNGRTIPQTIGALDTFNSSAGVTLSTYCDTLSTIIQYNWERATCLEQMAMSSAWGRHCSPVP